MVPQEDPDSADGDEGAEGTPECAAVVLGLAAWRGPVCPLVLPFGLPLGALWGPLRLLYGVL